MASGATGAAKVEALSERHRALYAILRTDPTRALEQARGLTSDGVFDSDDVASVRGAICIDAGGDLADLEAVEEGVTILRRLSAAEPHQPTYRYMMNARTSLTVRCATTSLTR